MELAEASTSIGLPLGVQGKRGHSRRIFGLFLYGESLAVAVQVGSDGFVMPMRPMALDKLVKKDPQHGSVNELIALLEKSHRWPTA